MKLGDIVGRLAAHRGQLVFAAPDGAECVRSFQDLHRDVIATAQWVGQLGLRPGARIGLAGPAGYAWMVWDLACIELGCVSVAFPNERGADACDTLIQRYGLSLLAIDAAWLDRSDGVASLPANTVLLDAAPSPVAVCASTEAREDVAAQAPDTHSLVFSSGTTGKTKGLVMSARGTEHLIDLYHDAFGVADGERFLTFLPFANYQQRMIYYFCLYYGIDFVSVPFQGLFAGLKQYQPSFLIAPPIVYETLQTLASAGVGKADAQREARLTERLSALTGGKIRYMVTGMAPIRRATLDFFWRHDITLYEAFGITEAGMVAWNKPGSVRLGSVGRPAEAASVSLTEEGEVIVKRDALLSLGYFEASEEDRLATFVAADAVATGDIGQFDDDGFLRVVGRKKDAIISSNGEKFHPEPIEAMLQQDSRIDVAVVMGSTAPGLRAVIGTRHHADAAVLGELRAHVAQVNAALPAQRKLVDLVFTGSEFSIANGLRTPNLKLNRRAIAATFSSPE
ncbi:AMP-binding protein [Burkholderia sp. Ac-20379]|uniref:AMP-binding protein n=1 Tax=Burkholderia sp. Ac-20379 TaxID=2703900 RepID=UPI001980F51C|nr:AMP-binding protein [Burkholderia sp. Ac-20379]MBN3723238.1 long-chain fatty acid--CoA ligase [Burkholderia sp. Ac-20379]